MAAGVCPQCGGPNAIGVRICQWCGSGLVVPKSQDFPAGTDTVDATAEAPAYPDDDELIEQTYTHDQRVVRYLIVAVVAAFLIIAAVLTFG